ncbi:hypothetical protein CSKR_113586 [Clonorchis sinensis]|uniref:Uncharacterized protein n=1 Tax=Clonorchis sinensis TaxID=79923 RepID=A0A419Q6X5_CLOSI|nr:hypothetical protein CSKR_113586 [Clonorchis sinensis]
MLHKRHMEYADDIALLGSDPVVTQKILNNLTDSASRFGMHFTPANSNLSLLLADEPIEVVDKFVYLGSCISPGGLAKDDISIQIGKARAAFDVTKSLGAVGAVRFPGRDPRPFALLSANRCQRLLE